MTRKRTTLALAGSTLVLLAGAAPRSRRARRAPTRAIARASWPARPRRRARRPRRRPRRHRPSGRNCPNMPSSSREPGLELGGELRPRGRRRRPGASPPPQGRLIAQPAPAVSQPAHRKRCDDASSDVQHRSERSPGEGRRILVVDDEHSIVDAVATALRYEGYEVDEAASGREALKRRRPERARPRRARLDAARHRRDRGRPAAARRRASRPPSSSSPPRTRPRTRSRRCAPAATTTSPSRSASQRSSRASRRSCAASRARSPGDVLHFADLVLDEGRHEVLPRRRARSS